MSKRGPKADLSPVFDAQRVVEDHLRREREQRLRALESGDVKAQLEIWPEPVRKLPGVLMRSALFTVVKGRERKEFPSYTLLAATKDAEIYYKGEELTQFDLTVWMHNLHLARLLPDGLYKGRVVYTPHAFLKMIGVRPNSKAYDQLWESQLRLQDASIRVFAKTFDYAGSLVSEVKRERENDADNKGRVVLALPPSIVEMFSKGDGWQFWQHRLVLHRDPLAQRLMALWSTFAKPIPYSTGKLFELAGLHSKAAKHRREKLKRVCEALIDIGFLHSYSFDIKQDTLHVVRTKLQITDLPPVNQS